MARFTIEEICTATGGHSNRRSGAMFIDISTDTRTIKAGMLFVALVGERFDGHDFLEQAIANGAAGVLISRNDCQINKDITIIEVADTLKAYQQLAHFHRSRFGIPVVAITGSNGKTTTKDMTAAVMSSRFCVLKTQANYNNEIGLPLTLLQLTQEHDGAVVEMGMRGKGEIKELSDIANPTIGVVTNVGETHMELLGSLENIAAAKAELVEAIPACGVVILNADDNRVQSMQHLSKARKVFYGIEQSSDVMAANIVVEGTNTRFICSTPCGEFAVCLPAVGKHNVYNALAAISVGLELGLTFSQIQEGLDSFKASAMRLAVQHVNGYTIINDAYNASPLSMKAAIDTLCAVANGRKIAILGDMLELGDIAVAAHEKIGQELAQRQIEIVITVGTLAANIVAAASKHGLLQAYSCQNHSEAQKKIKSLIRAGDTVLIKGSRGMQMEKIAETLL